MKLIELEIKNFKSIGISGCKIKIDEIVVLIGQNNAGKSTILDAYEAFASSGAPRDISEFHNEDVNNPIEIIGTFGSITDDDKSKIGTKWLYEVDGCERVKASWVWSSLNSKGVKKSFNCSAGNFEEGGMGGWDSLFTSSIPQPVRIRPTEPVDKTQSTIVNMLKENVKQQLKVDSSKTQGVISQIEALTQSLFEDYKNEFEVISSKIAEDISKIFPNTCIELVPKSKDSIDEKIVGAESFIKVSSGQHASPLAFQGTGIQRALLWSALDVMSGNKKKSSEGTKILLIDEPEAFLHPPTIRSACEMLYDFAIENPNWQVIATTHSPIFIDLAKKHTTIIRVDAGNKGMQKYVSTDEVDFDEDETTNLKMLRACNPIVNEFFFYDSIFLVEGPTEQIVLNHVAEKLGKNIHVIDCLGKGNIPMFAKILNKFSVPYTIIHDSDTPKVRRKTGLAKNGAWTLNDKIRDVAMKTSCSKIFVQFPHFEGHFLQENLSVGKVDNILAVLSKSEITPYDVVYDCYSKLINGNNEALFCLTLDKFELLKNAYLSSTTDCDSELWSD